MNPWNSPPRAVTPPRTGFSLPKLETDRGTYAAPYKMVDLFMDEEDGDAQDLVLFGKEYSCHSIATHEPKGKDGALSGARETNKVLPKNNGTPQDGQTFVKAARNHPSKAGGGHQKSFRKLPVGKSFETGQQTAVG